MSKSDNTTYFAGRPAEEASSVLLAKAHSWFNDLDSNGYLDKLREMWAAYHGAYYNDVQGGHKISFSGDQGEFTNLPVNHFRNIAQNILVMITATRPTMEARAVNSDYRSFVQTKLANSLLDYYMREKRLEKYLKVAVEQAIVLGAGFIKMEWNATAGDIYDYIDREEDPETGEVIQDGYPVYEGDVQFTNLSAFDVVFDSTKESNDHDWVLCRSFKNRFDLAAKYPEMKDDILRVPTRDESERYRFNSISGNETDDIAVYEFFHRRSESLPEGRYLLFVGERIVLMDAPMPYDSLPVYRIAPSDILGTPYGYSPMFDLLPLQEAINSLYTTILTNQSAFGVQNIIMPRGTDVNPSNLVGGLNLIEYNPMAGGKPEPLQLTNTPKEVFDFLLMLEKEMETLSGVNSVARGNPDKNLRTGNALALVQSMALQYMSGLQQSYVQMIEDVGTGLIKMLQRFAAVPRIAHIVGKDNRSEMREFNGDDLSRVNRVIVDVGNPLARTTAGRVEMAEQLLQMQLIKTPEQYLTVINTGRLEALTDDTQKELYNIKAENENLVTGAPVIAVFTDQHSLHIKEHKSVLSDPDLRMDPQLVQRTLEHIQEHINLLRSTDPDMLMMMGEQPLQQPGMMPPGQDPNQPAPPPQGGPAPAQNSEVMNQPLTATPNPAEALGINLPAPAQPPPMDVPPGMPVPQGVMPQ